MYEPKPDPMVARDLVGYGEFPPDPDWPGGASIAVNFNLNVEGGGEATLVNGDDGSEGMLNDIGVGTKSGQRSPLVESVVEFGRRSVTGRIWSFPIPTRRTTTASMKTAVSPPATTFSATCATPSTFSAARAKKARRSCCRSACMTG